MPKNINRVVFSDKEKKVFYSQSEILKRASNLLSDRIKSIEDRAKDLDSNKNIKEAEKEAKILIAVFQVRSIKLYKKIIDFLSLEIVKENKEYFEFLLPHSRTISDIYSRFLHLLENCPIEKNRALVCFALQLQVYKVTNSVESYIKVINFNKHFLKSVDFDFPKNPSDLSKKWIKKTKS